MKMNKLVLVFILLFTAALMFGQTASVAFRDATVGTRDLVRLEDPAYPNATPTTYARYWVQLYKDGGDGIMSPLDGLGNPTGDDILATCQSHLSGAFYPLAFGPAGAWAPSAFIFADAGGPGNTWKGDNVFVRIFNGTTIAGATKTIVFNGFYTVPLAAGAYLPSIIPAPINYWSAWVPFIAADPVPDPAVYVAPPNMATGLGYAGQTLSWNPAVTGGVPTGYRVYFGNVNPPVTMVSDQVGTTWATPALMQNTTYYWQVVPYNAVGDAEGNAIWSFTTRSELNPNHAENPVPANGATFASPVPGGFSMPLSWSAPSSGVTPSGYKLAYMGVPPIDIGNVLTTDVLINGPGVITWQIIPYYIDGGMRKVDMKPIEATLGSGRLANVRGDAVGAPVWSFTVTPYVAPTYAVNVTSVPVAPIYVNGVASGFNTPHVFQMEQGSSAVYSVVLPGYTWVPAEYAVTNIMAPVDINFAGTIMTYPVLIESSPAAPIYVNGVASGFDTPHTFFMNYGTSATYTVQLPQYNWVPENFVVSNIMAPASVNFLGTYVPGMYQFNVTSTPAGATIYMNGMDTGFVTPHIFNLTEGSAGLYYVMLPGYTWMPANYTLEPIMSNQAVNFVGTLNTYEITVNSAPAGAAIYLNGVNTGFVAPHVFTVNYGFMGTYSVQMAGYTWMPAQWAIGPVDMNATLDFIGTIITYTVDITSAPAGAAIYVDGMDSGNVTPYQFVMNYGASATYHVVMMGYIWTPAQFVVSNIMANAAQHFVGASFDGMIEPGIPEYMEPPAGVGIAGVTVLSPESTPFTIDYFIYTVGEMPMSSPNPLLDDTNTYGAVLSHSGGTVDLTVFVPAGMWYVAGYWGGMWHTADPYPYMGTVPGYVVLYGIEFGAKGDVPIWFSQLNPTVPVELQSFNAVVTAANFVSLTWVTATETGVLGFNVYRSDNGNAADAYKVNNQIIAATNTSQTATYNLIDSENLSVGNTYYYWLQAVDMNGFTTMNGPVNVTINGTVVPPMPELSTMSNAYPNPFRVGQSTTISVDIKAGETGTVTVYNLLGQTVKTFKVNEGQHNLSWNANGCASGIYFYKLSTPTVNSTKKLVIVN
jgi:hypothetical protein